ncbi:MAG: glycosyltransferase family 2 protein [Bacteroides sp.]|nr:glycosyltransferase family 2 protein [Bacteroides sp.]
MENKIIFSLIIPHKNIPSLLQRCLDSIPVREDLEIIIVDDNSDSDKIDFEKFPGKNRKDCIFIFNKKGVGAGAARNLGIEKARGKWLLFADADDTYTSELGEFLDENINNRNDIIYFKSNLVSENSKKEVQINMNIFIDRWLKQKGNMEDIKFGAWEPWNKMVKRDYIIRNGIRFDEISSSNDKMFSLRAGEFTVLTDVSSRILYNYILRPNSIIHSHKKAKFINIFNTTLSQNALYHRIKYNRKVFMPLIFLSNYKYLTKDIWHKYLGYLKAYKANPFEGIFSFFAFHSLIRLRKKLQK